MYLSFWASDYACRAVCFWFSKRYGSLELFIWELDFTGHAICFSYNKGLCSEIKLNWVWFMFLDLLKKNLDYKRNSFGNQNTLMAICLVCSSYVVMPLHSSAGSSLLIQYFVHISVSPVNATEWNSCFLIELVLNLSFLSTLMGNISFFIVLSYFQYTKSGSALHFSAEELIDPILQKMHRFYCLLQIMYAYKTCSASDLSHEYLHLFYLSCKIISKS